eukprot:1421549-Pleurochrysis_carterae.AAC.2
MEAAVAWQARATSRWQRLSRTTQLLSRSSFEVECTAASVLYSSAVHSAKYGMYSSIYTWVAASACDVGRCFCV